MYAHNRLLRVGLLCVVLNVFALAIFALVPLTVVFADRSETPTIELYTALVSMTLAIGAAVVLLAYTPLFIVRFVRVARGRTAPDLGDFSFVSAIVLSAVTFLIDFAQSR
jgi:hypothetical protein